MPSPSNVALNGRFLAQPVTGVQRFAVEILLGLDRLAVQGAWRGAEILVPRVEAQVPALQRLTMRATGRLRGHPWEQAELAGASRGRLLVSLGNTAPLLAGRRQIVIVHDAGAFDTPESYSPAFRHWYRLLQRGLVCVGAQIVTVSHFSRERLVARLGVVPDRVAVIREGADHILRDPADPGMLERHGLEPGRFALVVGSRAAHKNLGILSGAAALLAERGMTLVVAGAIDPTVFRTGADGIAFPAQLLGRVEDDGLRTLYENAVCLLFPSRYEGFGLPPIEALACGCPVLAASGHAVEEVCGDAALCFDGQSPDAVTAALARLLDEPGLAAALRSRGLARAKDLTWDAASRDLAVIIEDAAANHASGDHP